MQIICRKSRKFNKFDFLINRNSTIPSLLCAKSLSRNRCHSILWFYCCRTICEFYKNLKGMKFVCLHFYDWIIQIQQMLSTEPSLCRMKLLHFLSINHIICFKHCLSILIPINRKRDYFTLLINLNGCFCCNTLIHRL